MGGPTAATLSEAFSLLYGAAIGLTVGAAFVAFGAAILVTPVIALGAAVGARVRGYRETGFYRRSR
jgi:hypothetical protein